MIARFITLAGLVALLAIAGPAGAQAISVQSVTAAPALGDVSSAPTGDTVFRAAAADGMVTRSSGTGYRISAGTTRSLVTLACGSNSACKNRSVNITLSSTGTPTGRAGALTGFTVTAGTAQLTSGIVGTNPVTFTIGPIGQNSTATFYVGADLPIRGNDSGLALGAATSKFQVSAVMSPSGGSASAIGTAGANVRRALGIQVTSGLAFGTIARPNIGTGSVTIDALSGAANLTGNRIRQMPGTVSRAVFEVTGDSGQSFSVSVPPTFTLSGPGGSLTVQTSNTANGLQQLDGPGGTKSVGVGGTLQIPYNLASGSYTGSFAVTVQYQ